MRASGTGDGPKQRERQENGGDEEKKDMKQKKRSILVSSFFGGEVLRRPTLSTHDLRLNCPAMPPLTMSSVFRVVVVGPRVNRS